MSAILQAVNDVRTLARQAVALQQVVAVLDKLSALDVAEQEATQRAVKVKEQMAELEAQCDALKAANAQADARANEIAQGAQAEANRIVAIAQRQAEDIVSAAKIIAQDIQEEAQVAADDASRELAGLAAHSKALDEEIAAKQKELERITTALEEVRAKLR